MKITKSFLQDFIKYKRGDECGHIIHKKWVEGKLIESTHAQKLGHYFEYNVSGSIPKDGKIPEPERQKNGNLYADWQKALNAAAHVKNLLFLKGIKIIAFGKTLTKGRFEGTIDLICEATKTIKFDDGFVLKKGMNFVIDLKYSGLLEDRWHEMGWVFTDAQKEYHKWQARQYHYVSGLPFFYLVTCPPANLESLPKVGFFRINVTEEAIQSHIEASNVLVEEFELMRDTLGFEARPEYSRCQACQLYEKCKDKHTFPEPKFIEL